MASQNNKKPKLVRDSFTIPKAEFAAIETLKTRAIALGTSVKKSELLRAGLMALQGLNDAAFKAALSAVPTLKTGRPTGTEKKPEAPKKPVAKTAAKPAVKAATKVAAKPQAKPVAKPAVKAAVAKKVAAKPAAKKAAAPAKKVAAA
jgi:outer membrane biosynthesis protein TonB